MSNVCILNTGGTIGMKPTRRGLQPEPGFLASQLALMPELHQPPMPSHTIIEYEPVVDSANMTPEHWERIARDIERHYASFDGFLVLHGTDTMAYTSSALAFLLQDLAKPVILTGSQLPLGHFRNDARENLKTALLLAGESRVPEVGLFFGEVLLRGCRATKSSATRLDAFESPNYPPLGTAETALEIFSGRLRPRPPAEKPLRVDSIHASEIATFRLFPGMSAAVLRNVLMRPLKALILESYGVGNGPASDREFLSTIEAAHRDGIVLVNCTQCRHGCVSQTEYEVGRALADAGVISSRDMTIEATIAKLLYLFSRNLAAERVRELIPQNLVGELTPDPATCPAESPTPPGSSNPITMVGDDR